MKRPAQLLTFTLIVALSAAAGFYANHLFSGDAELDTAKFEHPTRAPHRPDFSLPDLDGNLQSIDNWNGKVIMVNFWATWCPPCRREIPAFIRLYDDYKDRGFVILGIAIDDPQSVQDFVDPTGINYPILLGEDAGIDISSAYGNRLSALPFTVFINREGRIIASRRQELSYEQAETLIKPLF